MSRENDRRELKRTDARGWARQQERGFEATCVKLPDGVNFFKIDKAGTYIVDILHYIVGKGNPRADEGFLHFEREYQSHRIATPNGMRPYCCQWATFGKKCAACDWLKDHGKNAPEDIVRQMRPSFRHLWNIVDLNSKERNVQVYDSNHFNKGLGFGEQIATALNSVEAYKDFSELKGGFTLHLTTKEVSFPGGKYYPVVRMDFLPRKQDYDDDMYDKLVCLDSCLVEVKYDTMMATIMQEPAKSRDEEESDRRESEREREQSLRGKQEVNGGASSKSRWRPGDRVTFTLRGVRMYGTIDNVDNSTSTAKCVLNDGRTLFVPVVDLEEDRVRESPAKDKEDSDKFQPGDWLEHPRYGKCEVVRIMGSGKLVIENAANDSFQNIDPASCKRCATPTQEELSAPQRSAGKPHKSDDDDWGN